MNDRFNYQQNARVIDARGSSVIQTNKVLRNTYLLLSLTLLFSALTAGWSMMVSAPVINPIITLIVYFALLFGVQATRNSPMGLVLTFALTGFLGWTLGPILNHYITTFNNGSELIMMALGATGAIFLGLSAIALNPKRDFSRLGSFLGIGALIALVAIVVNLFLQMPALYLALSVIIAFISGGFILWQTNQIVRGGETNYIVATVTIYVSILNIFLTILQFLGMFSGNRN
ncbi:Bax inhibitor-1/YccA family protein [Cysteiniphilum sp. QT6929]|uniref:Bax inhibitor-1/YccA family protein n=1 Tax=Cysteiniphilum sp. QT6929 TaxID=2975055 RepID=UPI0024B332C3|nr:Bax inhibitor-1/YccA family protein [Cysteiniphilum sp. QT6929]WHN66398.1 Bax inhibitor-1/YccA family protein [Cysteiniphilum sp. QT6929]